MSTWKNVGMTYLKYADLCATHLRNALKEPAKTKAMSRSDMRARVMQWTDGKRGTPGARRAPIAANARAHRVSQRLSSSELHQPRARMSADAVPPSHGDGVGGGFGAAGAAPAHAPGAFGAGRTLARACAHAWGDLPFPPRPFGS